MAAPTRPAPRRFWFLAPRFGRPMDRRPEDRRPHAALSAYARPCPAGRTPLLMPQRRPNTKRLGEHEARGSPPAERTGEAAAKPGGAPGRAMIREAENPEPALRRRAQRRIPPRFKTPPEAPLVDRTTHI